MIDDTAAVVQCAIDAENPGRVAIGLVDGHETHCFYLPREAARQLALDILRITTRDDRDELKAAYEANAATR